MSSAFRNIWRWLLKVTELSITELNGMLVLLPLILLLVFSQPIYRAMTDKPIGFDQSQQLDSLLLKLKGPVVTAEEGVMQDNHLVTHFNFDPNQSTFKDFMDLGFDQRIAARIIAYRKTGAKFSYKEDLLRIHEMDSAFLQQLWSFILLPERPLRTDPIRVKELEVISRLDINSTDTTQLKLIKGIGPVLSSRIIAYRNSLGGFVDLSQLSEVYGLKPEVIENIIERYYVSQDFTPRKININLADEIELKRHPYIGPKSARAIVTYRSQHGQFNSIEDLRNIYLINDSSLIKILPYIDK